MLGCSAEANACKEAQNNSNRRMASIHQLNAGDPGGSRTPNPQFRRLMLYPVELRGRPLKLYH